MKPPTLLTAEVVRKIRHDQSELLRTLAAVQRLGENLSDADLTAHLAALRGAFEDHVRRVGALLQAIGPGEPPSSSS